jgi:hypothetical protein
MPPRLKKPDQQLIIKQLSLNLRNKSFWIQSQFNYPITNYLQISAKSFLPPNPPEGGRKKEAGVKKQVGCWLKSRDY